MPVEQLPKRSATPRGDTKLVQYDAYIDRQVESTRRVVKIVDLATALVVLAAGVLAFLLAVAVVEHWIVPGGFSVLERTALFALLTCSVGYFALRRLVPLVVRKVNPVYAAHAIEQTGPTLKNSLVNLLLFRQKRSEISDAVFHTLEEQAAQRLSRVPVDAAVDRSVLIRFGYMLIGIVAIAAVYTAFSPKDPVVAARRVLMPWANIVPASRVEISNIEPGVVTVSRGEFIDVSAEVRGIGDDDTVVLRYTTADGQAVDKSLPMKLSGDSLRFEGRLPDEHGSTGDVGLAQNVTYRIEAGDARSLDYAVKVVEAPSILVERVEFDFPEYTGFLDRHVDDLGDIRAIEGTRVTVHARANGPIKEAHVDFDADGRRDLPMKTGDSKASVSFLLALREDRHTPEHASYVLRFANNEGRPNRNPVKHSIDVEPDYSPEAAIVAPQERSLDVRLDETVTIEVEARDPDFALADVRLRGQVTGHDVVDEPLLKTGHKGRFTARHQFKPSAHGLRAGDVVEYWVAANDNRTPQPNSTESAKKQFRIISPDPQQQPPPDRVAQRDQRQRGQQGDGQPQDGEQQPQNGVGGQEDQAGEQQPGGAGGQGQPGENQQPQQGQDGQEGQAQGEGEFSRDAERSAEERGGDKEKGRQGDSGEGAGGEDAAARDNNEGQDEQPGQQGGQSDQQARQGEKNSSDKQTGAGAAGGEPSQGAQPDGARPDGSSGQGSAKGDRQNGKWENGGQQPPPNAEPSPVSSDGDNDAEAFDRIQEHLERNGEMKEGDSAAPREEEFSRDAERSAAEGGGDKEKGRQGESSEKAGDDDGVAREKDANERDAANKNQPGESAEDRGEGAGAETKGGEPQSPKDQSGDANEQTKSPGGEQTSTKGPAGAGAEQKSQGAPNSKPEMKPTDKREQTPSQGEQSNKEEPPAGARGKSESDSQGEEGGDRAGGGEEGGGQKAPREGTGSAGQNQSAEEGAGESSEQGTGNDSPNAGQDAVADKNTGQPGGETSGRGSKTREAQGDQPPEAGVERDPAQGEGDPLHRETPTTEENARQNDGKKSDKGDGKQAESGKNEPQNANRNANQNGAPTGSGGEKGSTTLAPPRADGTAPDGDEANLEYARKQTDLVLEKLSDQLDRKRVDTDLLKQLGWSEEDMRKFVERWQARKEAAERNDQPNDAAKRELDEALRSLGLRRGPMKQGPVKDDTMRDLREGYRGPVPLEYQERLRAYNEGVSRARPDGE